MKISQTAPRYQLEGDAALGGATSFAGLPALLECADALGLSGDLAQLGLFSRGAGEREVRLSQALLALLASGGECLSDIEALQSDPGLTALLGGDAFPDARRLGEFLARFHDEAVGTGGVVGTAVLPPESGPLRQLARCRGNLVERVQQLSPSRHATLDWDTQCIEADKRDAHWTYKGFPGYQPAAVLWVEQGLVVSDQFRAGNVPSGYGVASFVRDAVESLPASVESIDFRGDSAAYDWKLMSLLRRRGVRFAITADHTEDLRATVEALPEEAWSRLERPTEHGKVWRGEHWAEVTYVSKGDRSRKDEPLRYLVIRYPIRDQRGEEQPGQGRLDFPETAEEFRTRYRVIATNRTERGDTVILWSGERCGSIERVYRTMNNEQAAARPPCGRFGANAAWYRYNVLLFNLLQAMRLLLLPEALRRRSLKILRLRLLRVAGRVVRGASRIWKLRVAAGSAALGWLEELRARALELARAVQALRSTAPT